MPSKASEQLEKIKSEKKLLIALVFALVAIFLWVAVSILSIGKSQIVEPGLVELAKPLVPSLDQAVLERIEEKRYIEPDQLSTFPIYVLAEVSSNNFQLIDIVNQSIQDILREESSASVEEIDEIEVAELPEQSDEEVSDESQLETAEIEETQENADNNQQTADDGSEISSQESSQ